MDPAYPHGPGEGRLPAASARASAPWQALAFWLGLALVAGFTLWAGLWHNDFPSRWHNDEPGKIYQVRQGTRNLHHPPLLLDAVALLAEVTGAKTQDQRIALLGRTVSAVCLAGAVVCVGLLGRRLAGAAAGLLAGALLGTQPLLVECAHYFKEDALHLLGLAAALLAAQAFWGVPGSRWRATTLGLALALCAAGKHSGWLLIGIMAVAAGYLAWATRRSGGMASPPQRWGLVAAMAAVGYAALCWPMLLQLPMAVGEIFWEMRKLSGGDYGVGLQTPHPLYLWVLFRDYGWAGSAMLLTLLWAGLAWLRPRKGGMAGAAGRWQADFAVHTATLYAVVYLVLLAFTAKFSERYAIPLTLVISLALPVGAVRGAEALALLVREKLGNCPAWLPRFAPALGLLALLLALGPDRAQNLHWRLLGFTRDSHVELERYIRNHTPPGTVVAADAMALQPDAALGSRHSVLSSWFAADLGSLEDLAARGVRYVAFSRDVAHRYFETDWAKNSLTANSTEGTRPLEFSLVDFYGRLAGLQAPPPGDTATVRTRLVWVAPYRDPRPLHPGLYLVELLPPAPPAE